MKRLTAAAVLTAFVSGCASHSGGAALPRPTTAVLCLMGKASDPDRFDQRRIDVVSFRVADSITACGPLDVNHWSAVADTTTEVSDVIPTDHTVRCLLARPRNESEQHLFQLISTRAVWGIIIDGKPSCPTRGMSGWVAYDTITIRH